MVARAKFALNRAAPGGGESAGLKGGEIACRDRRCFRQGRRVNGVQIVTGLGGLRCYFARLCPIRNGELSYHLKVMRRLLVLASALLILAALSLAKVTTAPRPNTSPALKSAAQAAQHPPKALLLPASLVGNADPHAFAHEFYPLPPQRAARASRQANPHP